MRALHLKPMSLGLDLRGVGLLYHQGYFLQQIGDRGQIARYQEHSPGDLPLRPVAREDSFLLKLPIADADLLAVFFNPDEGDDRPAYLHFGGRAHRRT